MLGRRKSRTWRQRTREAFWPTMGFHRLVLYYRNRMGRMKESPYAVAAGFASGVAVSFTPFIGFHILLGGTMAWALRGSMVAMLLGTVMMGNPWTFPFIWVATYGLGRAMTGALPGEGAAGPPGAFTFSDLLRSPAELLLPMTLGCLPFFVFSWVLAFYFARHMARSYKGARQARIAAVNKAREKTG